MDSCYNLFIFYSTSSWLWDAMYSFNLSTPAAPTLTSCYTPWPSSTTWIWSPSQSSSGHCSARPKCYMITSGEIFIWWKSVMVRICFSLNYPKLSLRITSSASSLSTAWKNSSILTYGTDFLLYRSKSSWSIPCGLNYYDPESI